jgi:cytochrome c oxidase assembly factor CtaG
MTTPLAHVGGASLEPLQLGPALAVAVLYALRCRKLADTGRAVPRWRQVSFYAGMALCVGAVASPLGHLSDELLLAHMAEHLLIADLGALLLVLGLTGPLIAPLLRVRWIDRLRVLAHPAVALPLWAANLYLWHLPAAYEGALRDTGLHALEHATFLFFGANMWMALFGPLPVPAWFGNFARLVYVVAVRLIGAVLGNVFVWSGSVFYDFYAPGEAHWGISPVADQNVAGAIMMVEGSIVTICLFGWLFLRSAREGEERQELLDLAVAQGVELTEERAARAVRAGRGRDLRRRLETASEGPEPEGARR